MIQCKWIDDNLIDYLYDELPDKDRPLFEAHLAECSACSAKVRDFQATRSILQQSAVKDIPAAPFLPENRFIPKDRSRIWRYAGIGVAAAMILLSLINFNFQFQNGQVSVSFGLFPQHTATGTDYLTQADLNRNNELQLALVNQLIETQNSRQDAQLVGLIGQYTNAIQDQRDRDMNLLLTNMAEFQTVTRDGLVQTNRAVADLAQYTGRQLRKENQ